MTIMEAVHFISAVLGGVVAALIALVRRLGPASWMLALFLVPASLSPAVLALPPWTDTWTAEAAARLSFALLIAAAPLGAMVSYTINREKYLQYLRERRVSSALMIIAAVVLVASLYAAPVESSDLIEEPGEAIFLGYGGYISGVFLLLVSVIVLANLEQTLRSAQERVRWEIKFLLLGLAGIFASIIYIASSVLLYPPRYGRLPLNSLHLFPVLFLFSCVLILVAWKRGSGRGRVVVAQGVVYSSITLLSVGIYLIASSLVARWASQWGGAGLPVEAVLFLLSLLALAVVLLWTGFRHRVKRWIRRHLLAGAYDYRQSWLQASERVQSIDPPETAAGELADMIQKAVGAINVSVWMRLQNPNRLKLVATRGDITDPPGTEVIGVVEKFYEINQAVSANEFDSTSAEEPLGAFIQRTLATTLVPLLSGGRVVGILTAGSDRSGQPYDWESLEFLGVLAKHAAGELHKRELLSTLVEAKETEAFRTFSTFLLHDLKNFASTLSLIAKNAARFQDNPDFQRDAFKSVFETAEKMKRLCNSLRTFSGTLTPNTRIDNLNQIARRVADSFSVEPGTRLTLDLGEVPPVLVDEEEIARVLQNLLLNAREAIPADGTIILRTRCHNGRVELSVEDDGRGMTREFIERELFLPFHTTKSDGLGIGLFQSKKIVEAHQGTIQVDSQEGRGTIVWVFLPVAEGVPAKVAGTEASG